MGYTPSLSDGYKCDDCSVFFWDEEDIINHVSMWHSSGATTKRAEPLDGTTSFVGYFPRTIDGERGAIRAAMAESHAKSAPSIPLDQVDARMEQAGREIRDLHERMDKVFATLNGGKSAQEAAYQRGRQAALEEAYEELMTVGYTGPAAMVRKLNESF